MGTKTEDYLRILAEGGDAPVSCCMTNTQKLIAQAIDRINNLGGDGIISPLSDYVDTRTVSITDLSGFISAIEEGKGFYMDSDMASSGIVTEGVYNGTITDTEIILSSAPLIVNTGSAAQPRYVLEQLNFHFDKTTGALDRTNPTTVLMYPFTKTTAAPGGTLLGHSTLTINIGSDEYTYDGTTDVTITILDGENMGF